MGAAARPALLQAPAPAVGRRSLAVVGCDAAATRAVSTAIVTACGKAAVLPGPPSAVPGVCSFDCTIGPSVALHVTEAAIGNQLAESWAGPIARSASKCFVAVGAADAPDSVRRLLQSATSAPARGPPTAPPLVIIIQVPDSDGVVADGDMLGGIARECGAVVGPALHVGSWGAFYRRLLQEIASPL